jgi:hypothetical protein
MPGDGEGQTGVAGTVDCFTEGRVRYIVEVLDSQGSIRVSPVKKNGMIRSLVRRRSRSSKRRASNEVRNSKRLRAICGRAPESDVTPAPEARACSKAFSRASARLRTCDSRLRSGVGA